MEYTKYTSFYIKLNDTNEKQINKKNKKKTSEACYLVLILPEVKKCLEQRKAIAYPINYYLS